MTRNSFEALASVLRALHTLEIPYMLVGSFSSNYYSYPRATKDADIEIAYSEGDLKRIRQSLDDEFRLDLQMSFETLTGSVRNILTHVPTKFDIELFRLGSDEHHRERFLRRRSVVLPELKVTSVVPSPEDVIIQKLRWHREKDIDDARKVLQVQLAKLDWEYIDRWTIRHGTFDLLQKLRSET
ncbi:MAG: DUF6036 family nucleotidyltransferase [Planctomycetota bacterium]|nr:DUF6036 family nucleotidyltransferase [Planctomycetota bacterium]